MSSNNGKNKPVGMRIIVLILVAIMFLGAVLLPFLS